VTEVSEVEEVRKRVILDIDRCVECWSCSAACFYSHYGVDVVKAAAAGDVALPLICRQCDDPACVAVCPAEAMTRDESGMVRRAAALCRGCGSCARACPFGVLDLVMAKHRVAKCDMCADRTAVGADPRCVSACPTGALRFAEPAALAGDEKILVVGGRAAGHHPIRRR
jgi:carbon-monoxide dehydrogenase iron sulfur subunit